MQPLTVRMSVYRLVHSWVYYDGCWCAGLQLRHWTDVLSVVQRFGVSTVYLFFSAVCAAAVAYVNSNVVETKGRSLEDIERELSPAV